MRFPLRLNSHKQLQRLHQKRAFASEAPRKNSHRPGGLGERLPIIPFVAILAATSGLYIFMVRQRASQIQEPVSSQTVKTGRYQRNA